MDRAIDFDAFYAEHRNRLVATLAAAGTDPTVAADSVDEAMARALERWDRIGVHAEPAGWVYVTARNHLRRRFRRHRRRPDQPPLELPPPGGEIWLLVGELPARQREVVALRYLAGLTEPAIAAALGISRGTVNSTLRDAHERLRTQLREPSEELA